MARHDATEFTYFGNNHEIRRLTDGRERSRIVMARLVRAIYSSTCAATDGPDKPAMTGIGYGRAGSLPRSVHSVVHPAEDSDPVATSPRGPLQGQRPKQFPPCPMGSALPASGTRIESRPGWVEVAEVSGLPTALNTENAKDHEGPRRGVNESDNEAAQAVLQAGGVDVHQQADADMAYVEVGQDLGVVRRQQSGDGLGFDNNGVRHHDVGAEAELQGLTLICHRHPDLPLERNAGLRRLIAPAFGIDGFEQARADRAMRLDRQPNDAIGQVPTGQHGPVSVALRGPSSSPC